ncbi:hypothetical protein V6N11_024873 [Hibiscus sabdariffa]|uniref:Uncharacterized protein n=1 Tax=Hibiscus sabdariffa TaxID=183260 RepID=A0ABR2QNE8_9ROSI
MKCQAALVCPKLELSSDGRELSTLMKGYALSLKKLLKKKKLLKVLVTTRKVVLLNTNFTQAELLRKTLMNIKLEVTTNFSEKYNPAKLLIASTQPWGGGGLAGGATKDDAEEVCGGRIWCTQSQGIDKMGHLTGHRFGPSKAPPMEADEWTTEDRD